MVVWIGFLLLGVFMGFLICLFGISEDDFDAFMTGAALIIVCFVGLIISAAVQYDENDTNAEVTEEVSEEVPATTQLKEATVQVRGERDKKDVDEDQNDQIKRLTNQIDELQEDVEILKRLQVIEYEMNELKVE